MEKQAFIKYFDMIYVINLETRADRRKEINEQLLKIGLSLSSENVTLFKAVKPSDAGEFPSIGAKGCFFSHLGVLKDCHSHQFKRILILEDDLNLVENFNEKFDFLISKLDKDKCDFFYGDYHIQGFENEHTNSIKVIDSNVPIMLASFIALNGKVVGELIKYFENMLNRKGGDPLGGPMHVDGAYSWFRRDHTDFHTVVATPPIGYQRSSRSDISVSKLKNSIPFINLYRVLKNKFRMYSSLKS